MLCPGEPKNMVSWPSCVREGTVAFKTGIFSGRGQFNHSIPFKGRTHSSAADPRRKSDSQPEKDLTSAGSFEDACRQVRGNAGCSKRLIETQTELPAKE